MWLGLTLTRNPKVKTSESINQSIILSLKTGNRMIFVPILGLFYQCDADDADDVHLAKYHRSLLDERVNLLYSVLLGNLDGHIFDSPKWQQLHILKQTNLFRHFLSTI